LNAFEKNCDILGQTEKEPIGNFYRIPLINSVIFHPELDFKTDLSILNEDSRWV
jgi:hypothetical protein